MLAADGDSGNDVVVVTGNHHPDRDLPVVGSVGGVKRAAAVIEANFALKVSAQAPFERSCFRVEGQVLAHFWTECKI